MKALVVYESMYGNTRDVAEAVARGLAAVGGEAAEVEVREVGHADAVPPAGLDLLVVGGPTHAFSMTRASTRADAAGKPHDGEIVSGGIGIREWIDALPAPDRAVAAATFDTRVRHPRLPGSAAKAAAKALVHHGYRRAADPMTFDVDGTTGPLLPGELERAEAWGASLVAAGQRV